MAHNEPSVEVQVMNHGQWMSWCAIPEHEHAHWGLKSANPCAIQAQKAGYRRGRVIYRQSGVVAWWWPLDDGMSDVEPYDADRRDKERRGEL